VTASGSEEQKSDKIVSSSLSWNNPVKVVVS
jgi:hypothetical protein